MVKAFIVLVCTDQTDSLCVIDLFDKNRLSWQNRINIWWHRFTTTIEDHKITFAQIQRQRQVLQIGLVGLLPKHLTGPQTLWDGEPQDGKQGEGAAEKKMVVENVLREGKSMREAKSMDSIYSQQKICFLSCRKMDWQVRGFKIDI